ncbi:hypothetical protein J2S40_002889 [Nocardioides luteus]|uniref:Uncharacterized protein n=1 Tax=Nocardioides luteus TaxID=1844 RepID=A0ABQ5SVL6_9ACTN|nr:hypothetical protein [Nocardioides luteus]MDR7311831.1 hypothetical protein [Nocardioides luteus]GGR71590.1 hypothetical protein GCM10010197_43790 [Nocardioides luteus]GLJ68075.1 hypothetical protein GCM10017579_21110 [Nocardioides luteus]
MFWIVLLLIAAAVGGYVYRVPIVAKLTGQPRSRIERQIGPKSKRLP